MKITAIIPTFNREQFILKAIKSIQNQTVQVDEIIVIDDGSTDRTKDILKNLDITYIFQKNKGVSAARNKGIQNAKNDWIAFLDSDDTWHETKIEKQINFHQQNVPILISHTNELWKRNDKIIHQKKHQNKPSGFCFLDNLSACKIGPSTLMIHKNIFNQIGIFDENLRVCEDYDLWLRISKNFEIGYLDEKLITKHAGHDNQLSFTTFAIDQYRIQALEKHLHSQYKEDVQKELIKKTELILKGARKHKNNDLIKKYEDKLEIFSSNK